MASKHKSDNFDADALPFIGDFDVSTVTLTRTPTPKDGNCFYFSVVANAALSGPNVQQHQKMKEKCLKLKEMVSKWAKTNQALLINCLPFKKTICEGSHLFSLRADWEKALLFESFSHTDWEKFDPPTRYVMFYLIKFT